MPNRLPSWPAAWAARQICEISTSEAELWIAMTDRAGSLGCQYRGRSGLTVVPGVMLPPALHHLLLAAVAMCRW
jgi:hypothetical protein